MTDTRGPGLDTAHQLPFDDFLEDVDIVVMGRRCDEEGQSEDYVTLGKRVIVATSEAAGRRDISPGIEFCDDVVSAVTTAREQGQHCFVSGAGCWSTHSLPLTPSMCSP